MDREFKVKDTVINTDRLILRAFRNEDLNDFYEYAKVEGVGEAAGWRHHKSIDETKTILDMFKREDEVFAIEYKENHKVIGSIGVHQSWTNEIQKLSHLDSKKLGYVLSKDYWGKGLMTEAVSALMDYLFNDLALESVTIEHFVENNRSKRVIEKNNLLFVGVGEFYSNELQKSFKECRYIKFCKEIDTLNGCL